MPELVSLKQKYGDLSKPIGAESDEYYPCLYLDEKQMEALGMDQSPRVGTEMRMVASVRVSSLSDSKNGGRSVSFEILEAGFEGKDKSAEHAKILYGNGK